MSDESLREIQLNGKQLVFLFMASTIVAVVIFLCGVMVGRGVSAAQAAAVTNSTVETGDPTVGAAPEAAPPAPAGPASDVPPDAPGDDDLRYPGELTADQPRRDIEAPRLPATTSAARSPAVVNVTAATPSGTPLPPKPADLAPRAGSTPSVPLRAEPGGTGFVVQVVATPRRAEAEAIQTRLQKKGYPAFVTTAGRMFRVRVGMYPDRADADSAAKRLETEERFKPWVTR
jgi:cell division septation protein DedD